MYLVAFTATKRYSIHQGMSRGQLVRFGQRKMQSLPSSWNHCVVWFFTTRMHTHIILSVFSIFKITIRIFRWQVSRFHWKKGANGKKTTTPPKVPKVVGHIFTWISFRNSSGPGDSRGKNKPRCCGLCDWFPQESRWGVHKNIIQASMGRDGGWDPPRSRGRHPKTIKSASFSW